MPLKDDMAKIPMIAVGQGELDAAPELKGLIDCPHCGKRHRVKKSIDRDGHKGCLDYYVCGSKTYLCGIGGKLLTFPRTKKL